MLTYFLKQCKINLLTYYGVLINLFWYLAVYMDNMVVFGVFKYNY